jgi:hypothetical protein
VILYSFFLAIYISLKYKPQNRLTWFHELTWVNLITATIATRQNKPCHFPNDRLIIFICKKVIYLHIFYMQKVSVGNCHNSGKFYLGYLHMYILTYLYPSIENFTTSNKINMFITTLYIKFKGFKKPTRCVGVYIYIHIHSFSSLFHDRSKASSKASSPHSAI